MKMWQRQNCALHCYPFVHIPRSRIGWDSCSTTYDAPSRIKKFVVWMGEYGDMTDIILERLPISEADGPFLSFMCEKSHSDMSL